ncbi:GPI ethanolamine phosphate transferase 3 [Holothuria leucospilota]|uniref:GPI ethanolamine phosphate transferase 3 n=1 Tax=Holothuria leucospilota TaxID=206669 RepID=A0A9Q1HD73_HOLLE|nr:GPI ethanolamine phosphate transferase 3 [Holothuria leucospilota]
MLSFLCFHSLLLPANLISILALKSVVNKLEEDTLLLVLGDHGMTKTGDHGGDSPEEVGAALFAYSPSQLWHKEEIHTQNTVSQIDLVPTVALLLGTPIPFSNLGKLIPDFFAFPSQELRSISRVPLEVKPLFNYVCALHRNVRQVKTYIETYHSQTGAFSTSLLTKSNMKYQEALTMLSRITQILESQVKITAEDINNLKKDLNETEKLFSSYLILVSNMCHEIWAQYDDFSIEIGFGIFSGMLFVSMLVLFGVPVRMPYLVLLQTLEGVCLWSSLPLFLLVLTLLIPASFILLKVSKMLQRLDPLPGRYQCIETDVLAVVLCCMHAVSLTSNSFVMSESYITSYFANSIMTFVFLWKVLKKKRSEPMLRRDRFRKNLKEWILFLLFLIASKSSQLFLSCREEQPWCDVSPFLKPLSSLRLSKSQFLNIRYLLSGACVFLPVIGLNRWFRKLGNHGVFFIRHFSLTYGLPLTAVCLWMNWALQAVPSSILDKLPAWQQTFLPRIAYLMIFGSLMSVLIDPVCARLLTEEEGRQIKEAVHVEPKTKAKDKLPSRKKRTTNSKYHKSEEGAQTDKSSAGSINARVPVVCGLGTVYSSNLLQVFISVFLLIALLLGDGLAPSLILMMVQMFTAVELKSLTDREENQKVPVVPVWLVALWSMMSMQYFFTTGHQATIPSIRFETAFIGYHGNYPSYLYWIPAVLIILNTFAAQVMFAVAVPFMFLWTLTRRNLEEGSMTDVPKGEMELQLDSDLFKKGLSHLVLYFVSFQALQLCGTMLSAALHRRHLMAWGIFAPRFIFEGVSFLVTLTALSLSCGFVLFTHRALGKWIDRHLNRPV